MPDEPEPNAGGSESSESPERRRSSSRRQPLTPELRRFLGRARSWHEKEAAKEEAIEPNEPAPVTPQGVSNLPPQTPWPAPAEAPPKPVSRSDRPRASTPTPAVVPDQKMSRALEMQNIALVIGALILLGAAFYAGTKVQKVKALLASRNKPDVTNIDTKKFPGLSADELVEQALAAERLGNWREAIERLLVAKRRDISYRDILFHAGKLCYDHGDFDSADRLLDRAIAYGDQVDTANYLRGLIATGRNDLPAAEQFFEAAIKAEPFTPGYYYYLGETLRREQRPKEAIARYEQAASRTVNEQDANLCRFKARIAKAETADRSQLENEVEQKRSAGPLSVEWQLTDAALKIEGGQIDEAAQIIQQARASDEPRLRTVFASCISDMLFTGAAAKHPEIANASRASGGAASSVPMASPSASASP